MAINRYNKIKILSNTIIAAFIASAQSNVLADSISPNVSNKGHVYSKATPDISFYGTGIGARYTEASVLRMQVERALQDGKTEEAIAKGKKAVQLDPGDPSGHFLLAKGLTEKFYANKGPVDEALLAECLREWMLIWRHDADQFEQWEAKIQARKLMKIAKLLQKDKEIKAKQEAEAIAETRQKEEDGNSNSSEKKAIAVKKKRFLLF
jgi:hypothetical protein